MPAFAAVGFVAAAKALIDVTVFRLLRPQPVSWKAVPAVLLKDTLLFVTWCNGLFSRTVDWRGNRLKVLPGTRLVPVEPQAPLELSPTEAGAREELLAG